MDVLIERSNKSEVRENIIVMLIQEERDGLLRLQMSYGAVVVLLKRADWEILGQWR